MTDHFYHHRRHENLHCPVCNQEFNCTAAILEMFPPSNGDFTICFSCTAVSQLQVSDDGVVTGIEAFNGRIPKHVQIAVHQMRQIRSEGTPVQ